MALKRENYYGKRLAPKLTELVNLSRGDTPTERLSLQDEVDMMRVIATKQLDKVLATALSDTADLQVQLAAIELSKKTLSDVALMVDKAARVRALATDAATVDDIEFVMNQVVGIIQSVVLPVDPILAQTVITQIENVKMPNRNRDLPSANQLLAAAAKEIGSIENG